jgi:two-component system, OmpR family, alkaline phosphatase synthesis response regulator PhoP
MAKTVLVVDDEPGIVKMVESRLKAGGYDVVTATDGKEGLRVCKLCKPDVAVLDVMMPGVSGDFIADAMRNDPALRHIPVIFLTALVKREGGDPFDDAYRRGPVGGYYYLAKPFKGNELLEMLARVLGEVSR